MINRIVVGTLSTLSTIMAPLGPGSPTEGQVYKFDLEPNDLIQAKCHEGAQDERSKVGVRFEKADDTYFTAVVKVKICTIGHGFRKIVQKVNLPNEILDEKFLLGLPLGQGYVINGVPSAKKAGTRTRVKITRMRSASPLDPVRVEWIPNGSDKPENEPLTFWIATKPGSFATVPGFTAGAVRWRRLEFTYKHPLLGRPFVMAGDLARIEQEQ